MTEIGEGRNGEARGGDVEFAEWVVSGLEQLRAGNLPGGEGLYGAVAAGLGDSTALDAYMNGGDDAARATLVQTIAQAVAANPAFEQQLRQAAAGARGAAVQAGQSAQAGQGAPGKQPFFKTTNGMLVGVAAAVIVVGGGVGLGLGLSGGGSLGSALKGTWHCTVKPHSAENGDEDSSSGTLVIGDKDWSVDGTGGTWKQDGDKVTLTSSDHPGITAVVSGVPTSTGPVDTDLKSSSSSRFSEHIKGSVSSSSMHLVATRNSDSVTIDCTR